MENDIQVKFSPPRTSDSEQEVIKPSRIESSSTNIVGKITKEIGSGDNAKHSFIWITIRWSFTIASVITLILFIFMGFAYRNENYSEISELKKFIITIWSIFTPMITLALGYSFGKDQK